MATRIAQNTLNASTIDILNVIRENASLEYQASVPEVTQAADIPHVGEIIYGTPAFANQFINALVNRIALVRANSATFNNMYSVLKKGYLEFGETVEEIFVNIAKVVDFDVEKAPARELKRTVPDVRSVFHVMNWRVMYPITIQDEDLKRAFLSLDGVTSLIAKIVDSIYTAEQYDEFLLFKYLIIKGASHGKMFPVSIDDSDMNNAAVAFRGYSNQLQFMSEKYNEAGVMNVTPKDRQLIFMDAQYNAKFDVEVLAGAFNMDKADFIGRLFLIDDFTTFDNDRFEVIRANSDGLEEVTDAELALLADVKAILIDEEWFQVYDNLNKMTEKYIGSGLYWNYFYHTWKTFSFSPYHNAIIFVDSEATITDPASLTFTVASKDVSDVATVLTFEYTGTASLQPSDYRFVQTEDLTASGIAVQRYGALIIPADQTEAEITLEVALGNSTYTNSTAITAAVDVGDTVTLAQVTE